MHVITVITGNACNHKNFDEFRWSFVTRIPVDFLKVSWNITRMLEIRATRHALSMQSSARRGDSDSHTG